MLNLRDLQTVKDALLMRLLADRGGVVTMRYEELEALGKEFDGWAVHLSGGREAFTVRVVSKEWGG